MLIMNADPAQLHLRVASTIIQRTGLTLGLLSSFPLPLSSPSLPLSSPTFFSPSQDDTQSAADLRVKPTHTPMTLVSSIDGPELVCLQLRPAGCHHRSLQIGFNLSIQVGTDQRPLPTPMRLLEFLPNLLIIQARSAPVGISTCRLVVALADVRMRVLAVAAIGEAPAAEVAWAGVALESIAAKKVDEGQPATRARQGEDLVDDVLTRHQHLTRVLV